MKDKVFNIVISDIRGQIRWHGQWPRAAKERAFCVKIAKMSFPTCGKPSRVCSLPSKSNIWLFYPKKGHLKTKTQNFDNYVLCAPGWIKIT